LLRALAATDPAFHHLAEKIRQEINRRFLASLRDQLISQTIVVDKLVVCGHISLADIPNVRHLKRGLAEIRDWLTVPQVLR
jgi:hypothetical protein